MRRHPSQGRRRVFRARSYGFRASLDNVQDRSAMQLDRPDAIDRHARLLDKRDLLLPRTLSRSRL